VRKGQPIAEIKTDKIVAQVEAPADGVLAKIVARPDEVVGVTGLLGSITAPGEELPPAGEEVEAAMRPPAGEVRPPEAGERVRASPRARRLARELGVHLWQVKGSGPGGRIMGQDVEAYTARMRGKAPPPAPEIPLQEMVPLSGVRALIAQRMVESARATAAVTLFAQAEASELVRLRAELRECWS